MVQLFNKFSSIFYSIEFLSNFIFFPLIIFLFIFILILSFLFFYILILTFFCSIIILFLLKIESLSLIYVLGAIPIGLLFFTTIRAIIIIISNINIDRYTF